MRYGPILLFAAFVLGASASTAHAAPGLEGYWKGSGTVSYKGSVDQVRCRVHYKRNGGSSYSYTSTCATENGRYELTGNVRSSGGNRYRGQVSSAGHKETGNVLLLQRGANSLSVTVTSGKGSAKLNLSRMQ